MAVLKLIIHVKRFLTAFFVKAVFAPIAWLWGLFFDAVIVPTYRLYSRLTRQSSASPRTIRGLSDLISSRYAVHILVVIVAAVLVVYNYSNRTAVLSSNEIVGKTYLARLIAGTPSDFDQAIEEYPNLDIARWKRPLQGPLARLEVPPSISTKEAPVDVTPAPIETPGSNNRNEAIVYTVKNGDALSSIARRFGVSVNTVLWENNLSANALIKAGDRLTILPSSGISHTVAPGQTLGQIAALYGVDAQKIMDSNNLSDPNQLRIGAKLVIPGGNKIIAEAAPTEQPSHLVDTNDSIANAIKRFIIPAAHSVVPSGAPSTVIPSGGRMTWPTTGHRITQYFSYVHTGVDIADHIGTPIYAAGDGVIVNAGWNRGGYGNMILVDHGGGKKTRYGHLSAFAVNLGQHVSKGQYIGAMGSTGHSTGPHLHFEVILNGHVTNPLNYVR